jgi:hypothetical protein
MKLKHCIIGKFHHFKKMKAAKIHSELALCFGNDGCVPPSVHPWIHEFKTGWASVEDKARSERPSLDDVDAAILKRELEIPFSSLWTLNEDLHIPKITVWKQMMKSLCLQRRDFERVPHMLK